MANKNVAVNLTFTANTQQAKQQLQSLQSTLSSLTAGSSLGTQITADLQQGINAAAQLKVALTNATNVNTGKLDLGKFNQQLKQSNMGIKQYAQSLASLGPQGSQAFLQLARAMQNAENPMMRLSAGMRQLGTTLMNTARWQISSSILMGFTSAVSGAVSYAKELNTSLNDIRIVTGKSVEEMELFAEKANQAAKALSTTTTAYTDAALIYYQQGLDGKAVLDRANTTVKLANVVGKSAQEVSEWTTAIWNNFYDGTESLESYADSLVALGASTASSADEIAQGLEKFAAVGDTVGLSFDYAAAALATVTAQTRQSADVVGTAFKTLFARMQDLKLGNTLEDGTTLGQYSEAMFKVGVNIKTASGELKDMDVILDELGARWKTLDKDQQVALAKSVAGLRQYNQFIALMSNYDTFKMNVETSETSDGELERQAQVYAESWEGAAQRVKAAAESVYSDLIDDDFFIDIMNFFAGLLETVDKFIDAAGGLPVLLGAIAAILMRTFQGKIVSGIESLVLGLRSLTVHGREAAETLRTTTLIEAKTMSINTGTTVGTNQAEIIEREITLQETLNNKTRELSGFQAQIFQARIEGIKTLDEENLKLAEQIELLETRNNEMADNLIYGENSGPFAKEMVEQAKVSAENVATIDVERETLRTAGTTAQDGQVAVADIMTSTAIAGSQGVIQADQVDTLIQGGKENFDVNFDALVQGAGLAKTEVNELRTTLTDLMSIYEELGSKDPGATFEEMGDRIDAATGQAKKFAKSGLTKSITSAAKATGSSTKTIEKYTDGIQDATKKTDSLTKGMKKTKKMQEDLDKEMKGAKGPKNFTASLVNIAGGITSATMGLSMLQNALSSAWEMFEKGETSVSGVLGVLMSLGMAIPMIIKGTSSLAAATGLSNALLSTNIGLSKASVAALFTKTAAEGADTSALLTKAGAEKIKQAAEATGVSQDQIITVLKELKTGATLKEALATAGLTKATWAQVAANLGLQASLGVIMIIIIAIIALAVGLVMGIMAIVNAVSDWYNADKLAAEQAAKHAEETAAAYEKVKEKYEELKKSLEDYNKAQNAIAALKEGTEEWRQAIQDSNAQVLELLDKYPELAKYVENINGRLVISDANQLKMYNEAQEEVALMNNINTQAQLDADKAWQKSQKTNVVRAIDEADVDEDDIRKGMDLLAEKYADSNAIFEADEYAAFVEDLKAIDEDLVDVFNDNKEAIQDLIVAEENLASREALVAQSKVDNLLYSQENFNAAHYGKNVQERARKAYTDAENKAKAANKTDDWHDAFIWHYSTDEGEKAFAEYAKLMGYEDADATDFQKDKIVFEYKGEDGDTVEDVEVTYEQMQKALIEKAVAKEAAKITAKVNQMTSTITNLSASKSTSDQALATFLEEGDLSYLDPAMATKLTDSSLTDEEAKAFGYSSAKKAMEAFNKALEDYDPQEARSNILVRKAQEIDSTLTAGAESLGISKEALEMYAASLVDANAALEGNEEEAAELAVRHYKLAKGVNSLQDTFKKYSDVLKNGKENSLDYYEALGALKKQVEDTFGLKVSAKFIKGNLEDLEAMANGDEEALARLQKALVSDYVLNLSIDEEYRTALDSALQDLMKQAEGADLHTELTLDNTKAIDAINTALRTGAASIEDIEAMFNNANLAMPEYKIAQVPHTSTSQMNTKSEVNILGAKIPITTTGTTTTTTYTDVPYFGDNPPTFDENGKMTDSGGGGSLAVTTIGNAAAGQDILDYEGDGKTDDSAEKAEERIEDLEDELDRYHEINEIIQDTEQSLKKLSTQKDRAYGSSKLALMDQEIAKQKELIENNKTLLAEAEDYYESDRKDLMSQWAVKLDSTGRITNYEDIQQSYINRLKAVADDEDAYEALENEYEDFKNTAARYEESLNKVEEQAQAVEEAMDALYDMNMEKIEYKVQIKVEIAEDDQAYIDFLMQEIEDDAFSAAEAISLLGNSTASTIEKIRATEEGITEVQRALAAGEITQEQATEKLREYRDELIDLNADLLENRDSVQEKLTDAFEGWHEELEKGISTLEHYGSVLSNYKDIIDLVGKDMLGLSDETMKNLSAAQVANANNTIRATKAQLDANQKTVAKLKEERAKALARGDEESVEEWDKQIEIAEEKGKELTLTLQEALSNGLQLAVDDFALTVEQIADNFSKAVSGIYDSIEDMREGWDRMQEIADRYLETYQQTYEISKLNRQIENSINKTDSIASQTELRDLQKEIYDMTKDGQQMSKYDLQYLQNKYNLLLAEQALKDAQNAKSVVRLQRDSEGNFGYVYTADQNAIDQAEQAYEDSLYQYQDFIYNMDKELTEFFISTQENMDEEIRAAAEKYGLGTEAFLAEVDKIEAKYAEDMNYITGEYSKMTDRNVEINNKFNANVADTYNETFLGKIQPDYDNFAGLYAGTTENCKKAAGELGDAVVTLRNTFDHQFDLAGEDFDDFAEKADEKFGDIQSDSDDTADKVEDMAEAMDTALNGPDGAINAVTEFQKTYSEKMKEIRKDTEDTIKKINELLQKQVEANGGEDDGKGNDEDSSKNDNSGTGNYVDTTGDKTVKNDNDGDQDPDKTPKEPEQPEKETYSPLFYSNGSEVKLGDILTYNGKKAPTRISGTRTIMSPGVGKNYNVTGYVSNINRKDKTIQLRLSNLMGDGVSYFKIEGDSKALTFVQHPEYQIKAAYDTGGYTGEWGPEGRIAMLHQKEIVLNAHDTENLLTAVDMVRSISNQLEQNALAMRYAEALSRYHGQVTSGTDILQQEIHITAEFPNATNHFEIEEAFRNMANLASQYANRKS